jgi:hypothetical protein
MKHRARGGLLHAGEKADQRRLTGAVLTKQRAHLASTQTEVDIDEGGNARVDVRHADGLRDDVGRRDGCRRHGEILSEG